MTANGFRASFGGSEKVLELDRQVMLTHHECP